MGIDAVIAAIALLLLPGAWLAFGLPLRTLSYTTRLSLAVVLSPVVVVLQFLLIRVMGASFEQTIWILLLANAGSLWFLIREWKWTRVPWGLLLTFTGIYLLLAACAGTPWYVIDRLRIYGSHNWMHFSIIYQFPQGTLLPVEPDLAGCQLRYPWLGNLYWAILGAAMDVSPSRTAVVLSVVWLLCICVLTYQTCRALGASPTASLAAIIWMALGLNVAGDIVWRATGHMIAPERVTPWLSKFIQFNVMPLALGFCAALPLVGIGILRDRTWSWLTTTAFLLLGIGLIYPVMFPPAMAFCIILLVLVCRASWKGLSESGRAWVFGFLLSLVLVGFISAAHVKWLSGERSSPGVTLALPKTMLARVGSSLVAFAPYLAALLLLPRRKLLERTNLLCLSAAGVSFFCYVLLNVSAGHNEYKFMFMTAMLVVPVACLVLDKWTGKIVSPAFVLLASAVLLLPPILSRTLHPGGLNLRSGLRPQINDRRFHLELLPSEPDRLWINAVRSLTPPETAVVIRDSNLYLPAITERSLFAPFSRSELLPGYVMSKTFNLVGERGYSPDLLAEREAAVRAVFECQEETCKPKEIEDSLTRIGRPIALVFFEGDETYFLQWLKQGGRGRLLYEEPLHVTVWLLDR